MSSWAYTIYHHPHSKYKCLVFIPLKWYRYMEFRHSLTFILHILHLHQHQQSSVFFIFIFGFHVLSSSALSIPLVIFVFPLSAVIVPKHLYALEERTKYGSSGSLHHNIQFILYTLDGITSNANTFIFTSIAL